MTTTIEQNIKAREAANVLVELGIGLGKEEGLAPEQVRHMWKCVMEIINGLIGYQVAEVTTSDDDPTVVPCVHNWIDVEQIWPFVPDVKNFIGTCSKCNATSTLEVTRSCIRRTIPVIGVPTVEQWSTTSDREWLESFWPDVLAYIDENGLD